ncbi:MAG: LamG-like jellyroll fold domain-containing protein [Chthoniobacteraceae bacterium]
MKAILPKSLCSLLAAFFVLPLYAQVNVVTYHNDLSRTGQNLNETILTPANVNPTQFGQLFQYPVDGNVYAQPLYLSNVTIPGQGVHNVVFICTEHNSVYAFDADSVSGTNGGLLWHVNLGPSAATPNNNFGNRYGTYGDIVPEVGITGTPAIDATNGILYVDTFTNDEPNVYNHRIHALSIFTGSEELGGPLLVSGTYPGTGVASSSNGVLDFANEYNLNRPALTFLNNQLFVAYSGYGDTNPYHGWILAFNTSPSLSSSAAWVDTPNSSIAEFGGNAGEGGIWMGADGLAVDPNTNNTFFFSTGNGIYGNATGGFTNPTEFGDSLVKITTSKFPNSSTPPTDWFTPYNQASLQDGDEDLGSAGTLLLPNSVGSSAHPHLMIGGGKQGLIYLVDRDTMTTGTTHYDSTGSTDSVVQSYQINNGSIFATPAYFNGSLYYACQSDVMKRFTIANGVIAGPISSGTRGYDHPGASPSISASGTSNGLVWVIAYGTPSVLSAFNASNVSTEIYSSDFAARDTLPNGVKWAVPTIANGKVYVGASGAVAVFGLLPIASSPPTGAPTNLTAQPVSTAQINLAWTYTSSNQSGFEILRSTDGVNYSAINIAPADSETFQDTSCTVNTTYYYMVYAENTAGLSGSSNIVSATTLNNQANVGLVAYWAFDDGGGLIAADSVGGDDGTLVGEVTWTSGPVGGALNFHGGGAATARVSIPDEAAIDFSGTQSFTVTAWVEPANTVGKYSEIISKSRASAPWYELGISSSNNWIFRGTASDITGTPVPTAPSGWHHLAAVQNGAAGTRTLYVDGVPVATGSAQAANGTGELVFAEADGVNESFSGILGEVRIYDVALPVAEIATLAQTTWADSDIGDVGVVGSATIYHGLFTVNGSGADIWNNADAFHYVYQKISGDCVVTARVDTVEETDPWAKGGVMIRETLDPGAAFADCVTTPANGTNFQWRQVADNACGYTGDGSTAPPYWVRMTRTGNVITGYESATGTTWNEVGSETFTMVPNVYVGLCACAHNNADLGTSTMDNITVSTEGSLAFSNALYTVSEQGPSATITVSRTGGSLDAVGVTYSTVPGGSAASGTSYVATSGTLSWANGDSSTKSFTVPIIDPNIAGPNLSVDLALSNPTGGVTLGPLSTATLTIIENSYNTWLYEVYGGSASNPAYSAPLATPDNDGIPNLLKYAMSINPGVNAQAQMPTVATANGHPQITFQWNYNVSDVTYVVQASNSPNGTWTPLATYTAAGGWVANVAGVTISPGGVSGNQPYQYEPVVVTDPATLSPGQSLFLRVSVTR